MTDAYDARALLAANLQRLMEKHPDKDSAEKMSKVCAWTAGTKKGKKIAPRTIGYVLDTRNIERPSPGLDLITSLADAFKVRAWQLLVDERELHDWAVRKLSPSNEPTVLYPTGAQSRELRVAEPAPKKRRRK